MKKQLLERTAKLRHNRIENREALNSKRRNRTRNKIARKNRRFNVRNT